MTFESYTTQMIDYHSALLQNAIIMVLENLSPELADMFKVIYDLQ